jgi:hypothetical protein
MTKQEKQQVRDHLASVYLRINKAKEAIREHNYGIAERSLSEAYPKLDLVEDE